MKNTPPSAQTKKCFVCGTGDISPDPMVYNKTFGWFHRECSPCTVETKQASAQTDLEIHKPVIETMKSIGFGLLNDGETFYKLGYEIYPRGNITFTMNQAYEIHKALSSERTRLLSVESMKMEEEEYGGDELHAPELDEDAVIRNELRQSIVKELK